MGRQMVTKKGRSTDLDWYDTSEEAPNPTAPDGYRLARRQRWTRRYVKLSVILCPVITLVAIASVARTSSTSTGPSISSPGRTAATIAIEQWLAERPSPLPGAAIVSYDGASPVKSPKTAQGTPITWRGEIENFTLATNETGTNPVIWSVGVEVAIDHSGGATAVSGPSFLPGGQTSSGSWDSGAPWPGLVSTTSVSGAVQTVINNWLAAYTSGNNAALHLAVGDTNANHVYTALSGVRSASDTILAAAQIGSASQDEMIVEVSLNLVWNGEASSSSISGSSGSAEQLGPSTTMDLLVARASSAAPVVVAWGPPGSGPALYPYENAESR